MWYVQHKVDCTSNVSMIMKLCHLVSVVWFGTNLLVGSSEGSVTCVRAHDSPLRTADVVRASCCFINKKVERQN
jgi:hypothetical protein